MNKRGQVAIWIIGAIAVVAVIAIIFLVNRPGGGLTLQDASDPQGFLESCLEDELIDNLEIIASQGGDIDPEGYLMHGGERIRYLCHSSEFYELCSVQQPLLKEYVEQQVMNSISGEVEKCVDSLVDSLERSGSSVSVGDTSLDVEFVPRKVVVNLEAPLTVSDEVSRNYRNFDLEFNSEMHDILAIAESIVGDESRLGDTEVTAYTQFYPDLIIRKDKLSDGSTIYEIENVVSEESFKFASRSLAWPSGFTGN